MEETTFRDIEFFDASSFIFKENHVLISKKSRFS